MVIFNVELYAEFKTDRSKVCITNERILERIIKTFLKRELVYSFKLISIHGLVSGITILTIFLLTRPKVFFKLG